jgi:hypothetical protein
MNGGLLNVVLPRFARGCCERLSLIMPDWFWFAYCERGIQCACSRVPLSRESYTDSSIADNSVKWSGILSEKFIRSRYASESSIWLLPRRVDQLHRIPYPWWLWFIIWLRIVILLNLNTLLEAHFPPLSPSVKYIVRFFKGAFLSCYILYCLRAMSFFKIVNKVFRNYGYLL